MAQKSRTADQIEVDVTGFFTTHHRFQTEAGSLGSFTFPAFSQDGVFRTADGRELLMHKTHWLGTAHELVEGDVVHGTADRPGCFRTDLAIWFRGREYRLEPAGTFSDGWYLLDAEGNILLELWPRGILKEGAYVTLRHVVAADLIAFAYYLVHVRKQETAAAAAAAAAGAAAAS